VGELSKLGPGESSDSALMREWISLLAGPLRSTARTESGKTIRCPRKNRPVVDFQRRRRWESASALIFLYIKRSLNCLRPALRHLRVTAATAMLINIESVRSPSGLSNPSTIANRTRGEPTQIVASFGPIDDHSLTAN
jgi:hypothetical protein